MITLLGRDTCKPAYIPEDYIDHMDELVENTVERAYPYTRIYIKNPHDNYDYYIDVVESKKKIEQLIQEKKEKSDEVEASKPKKQKGGENKHAQFK